MNASGGGISAKKKHGVFYGVGLGPGDAELLTLKAARLIRAADVVAYPALPGRESLARRIVADLLAEGVEELRIEVPMAGERAPAQAAYDAGAARIAEVLGAGRDVMFLCEGDPLFYGSFMYLQARLTGRFAVKVVPGVASPMAGAAAAGLPLAARDEVFCVLPATLSDEALRVRLALCNSAVIMKLGRHMGRVRALLTEMGLAGRAQYVARVGMADQLIRPLEEAPAEAPYFSMILVVKGADPWL